MYNVYMYTYACRLLAHPCEAVGISHVSSPGLQYYEFINREYEHDNESIESCKL